MTKQVQRRRGTATQHTSFTGAEGEISVNTTNKSVHVHDGSTAGGIEAARADLTNVADADLNTALSGNTLASLTITSADINGGSIDGTTIGASSAAAITGTTITGTSFVSSGDMSFGDNDKAIFGAGNDLQIYSDGTNGYIEEAGGGNLRIITNGPSVAINKGTVGGENMALFNADGAVQLFYDGSQKLATTSTGVDVSGTLTSDGLTVDGDASVAGTIGVTVDSGTIQTGKDSASSRSHLVMNNPNGVVAKWDTNGADLLHYVTDEYKLYTAGNKAFEVDGNGDISFYEDTGTTPKFFWDASAESLGIGTSSPSGARLHISDNAAVSGVKISNTGTSGRSYLMQTTSASAVIGGGYFVITDDGAGADRFVIDSSGNVGIGTSSPTAVSGTTVLEITGTSGNAGAEVIIGSADTAATGNDLFGGLAFKSIDSNGTPPHYSGIKARAADTFGGANLEFYAGRSNYESNDPRFIIEGPQSVSGEAMRIDSSGNVGIGTTSGNEKLNVSGAIGSSAPSANFDAGLERIIIDYTGSAARVGHVNGTSGSAKPLLFMNGGTERMRIDSSGNLLVGKTSLDGGASTGVEFKSTGETAIARSSGSNGPLYINRISNDGNIVTLAKDGTTVGSIGVKTPSGNDSELIVGSTDCALRFKTPVSATAFLSPVKTDATSLDGAMDLGDNNERFKDLYLSGGLRGDTLKFSNLAGTERMRIDSSGNLLVGGTDTFPHDNAATSGTAIGASGYLSIARSGGISGYFNRMSSDGDIVQFRKDGTTVGSIGSIAGNSIYAGSGNVGVRFSTVNDAIYPSTTSGNNRDAATDLGISTVRFKDLYLSGGVYLGGTGSANKLDDYETGNYQPTLSSTGGGTVSASSIFNLLSYTKVGRFVHIQGNLHNLTISGVSGDLDVTLPFVAGGGTERSDWAAGFVMITEALTTSDNFPSGGLILPYFLDGGNSYIRISGGADQLNTSNQSDLRLSFQYITSA